MVSDPSLNWHKSVEQPYKFLAEATFLFGNQVAVLSGIQIALEQQRCDC
jgi:pyruvate/2-oxoacid:ferredoxin oxidoreductase beta subunit